MLDNITNPPTPPTPLHVPQAIAQRTVGTPVEYVFCDFEYRPRRDGSVEVILGSFMHVVISGDTPEAESPREWVTIDFRSDLSAATAQLVALTQRWGHAVWTSFAAHAEITAFLTLGVSVDDLAWLCLYTEARQITGSHPDFFTRKAGLLYALEALGIPTITSSAHKEAMRLRIIEREPLEHSPADWDAIVRYNHEDIARLPELWLAIRQVHALKKKSYPLTAAVYRAEYLKSLAKLEFRSRGFPVDVALMQRIYGNLKLVRNLVAEQCNTYYGGKVFRYNAREDKYSVHFAGLVELVDHQPFPTDWALTPSGRLRTDVEYLEEFAKTNPQFKELKDTLVLLAQLKEHDLRQQEVEGFVKGVSIPYYTVTGRNQPMVKRGFLMNLPPWLRFMVRPHQGHVLIMADWSQQEIYVAAALSGDVALRDALLSGDVYIAMAKKAGLIPDVPEASKQRYPNERQVMKSCVLGIGYGMGVASLGKRIFLDQRSRTGLTLDECTEKAAEIVAWHRETFFEYWSMIADEVSTARQQGWMRTRDGWTQFADQNSRYTKLQNFHMQAGAAVILREAVRRLAQYPQIEMVCTLHDSIMLYAPEEQAIEHENILRRCMEEATRRVLRNTKQPLDIPVEVKQFTHESGYQDPRGREMFDRIMAMLDANGV